MVVLLLLLLVPLGASCFSYGVYWYEAFSHPRRQDLPIFRHRRPLALLAWLVLLGFRAQCLAAATFWLARWPGVRGPLRPDDGPVVVMVHGLYHSGGGFILLQHWLRAAGFANLYAPSLDTVRQDVPALGARLRQLLGDVRARHPGRPLLLVGQSLGGLVIRAALDSDTARAVAGVVTLGTPHQGSRLAAFGPTATARALRFQGPLARTLPVPEVPWLCLITAYDNMVHPAEGLLPPAGAAWEVREVGLCSHVGMLYDRRVASMVAEALRAMAAKQP